MSKQSRIINCQDCKLQIKHYSKGRCFGCYKRQYRKNKKPIIAVCQLCEEKRQIMASNLCGRCYKIEYKIKKFGHFPKQLTKICSCDAPYFQSGLCKACFWKLYRKTNPYKKAQIRWKKTPNYRRSENARLKRNRQNPTKKMILSARKQRRHALKRSLDGAFTKDQWLELRNRSPMCPMCGKFVECINLTLDHLIPITRGGTNDISNIQTLCRSCNSKKNVRLPPNHLEIRATIWIPKLPPAFLEILDSS